MVKYKRTIRRVTRLRGGCAKNEENNNRVTRQCKNGENNKT